MHSGLRRMGEAVKDKNENLLTCGQVRAYAYVRSARGCARSLLLGREMEKWGGMRKKVGEGAKRMGDEERKGSRSGDEGGAGREE